MCAYLFVIAHKNSKIKIDSQKQNTLHDKVIIITFQNTICVFNGYTRCLHI